MISVSVISGEIERIILFAGTFIYVNTNIVTALFDEVSSTIIIWLIEKNNESSDVV
jgi:hypothetical protein